MPMSGELRHVRAPVPVHFPDTAQVPETKQHLKLRTMLFQLLELAFADRASIGSDQFVYWDPTDANACLAPDAFVRLGESDQLFRSWKVWERGAPQLAIEVVSESDARDQDWEAKLARYRRLGVAELLRFDPNAEERPLRIWDSLESDLVERGVAEGNAQSRVLPGHWLVVEQPGLGRTLRLSQDAHGARLYPTPEERMRQLEAELAQRNG
jgi:Uma2 family endonuclease